MSVVQWVILLLLIVFVVKRFLPVKGITNITVQEAKDKFKDKTVQFIDVRTPGEYQSNHQRMFKNIPLFELSKKASSLDREKETVIICQSGMRSAKAARVLKKQGFEKIYNVKGGMSAWR